MKKKLQGEYAESAFLQRAIREGFVVCKPWGDSARFDFVVERRGRLSRVQVKSVSVRHDYGYHIITAYNSGADTYSTRDFDFLAAYIIPLDLWYIIPVRLIAGRSAISLNPDHPPGDNHRYEPFREAWDLLP